MRNLSTIVILISTSSPQAKWDNFAKQMESSKSTAKHIKQVASNPQAAKYIWCTTCTLNCHPASSKEKRNLSSLSKIQTNSTITMKKNKEGPLCTRNVIIIKHTQAQRDVRNVEIHNMLKDLDVQLVSTNAEIVTNMVNLVACTRGKKH